MPLPLAIILLLLALVLLSATRWQRLGRSLIAFSALLLSLLGVRPVSVALAWPLERQYPAFATDAHPQLDAIVVLGHGHSSDPSLPLRAWQSTSALARTLEGVRLAQHYPQAKLIFSGYSDSDRFSNAEVNTERAIELGITPARIQRYAQNKDTHDEALTIAHAWRGQNVALVTSASHMPRAMALYQAQGLSALAAPTDYLSQRQGPWTARDFIPRATYLRASELVWHEWLGLTFARWRGQIGGK
ncbi:MAG: YdcF family protein [Aeromonas sp.]